MKFIVRSDLLVVLASLVFAAGVWWWLREGSIILLLLVLVWSPWPILAAIAQRQRGGSIIIGLLAGLLAGPLGLLDRAAVSHEPC